MAAVFSLQLKCSYVMSYNNILRIRHVLGRRCVVKYVLGLKLGSYAQFAPCVYFWTYEQCFKNLHGANLHPGANLLLLLRWSKFICTRVQFVHMNAK